MSIRQESLFRTKIKKDIWLIFIFQSILNLGTFIGMFITGLIGYTNDNGPLQIWLFVSFLFLILYLLCFWMFPSPDYYNKIKKLLDEENEGHFYCSGIRPLRLFQGCLEGRIPGRPRLHRSGWP